MNKLRVFIFSVGNNFSLLVFVVYSRDILDYVLGQVPPPQPHQPRPRFSLYLSSQLQYGVVVVYHKQCSFLLGEIKSALLTFTHPFSYLSLICEEMQVLVSGNPSLV